MANCALSFYTKSSDTWARYTQGTTVAAPAEPAMQISIGGGQVSIDAIQQGPGEQRSTRIQQGEEGTRSLYQIELDRRGHACRHEGAPGACD